MTKGLPVISARQVTHKVLEDLFDSVNEGDVSIPVVNAWGGLEDAMIILGMVMRTTPQNTPQIDRYKEALRIAGKHKKRRQV